MSWAIDQTAAALAHATIEDLCQGEDLTAWLPRLARGWWQLPVAERHRVRAVLRCVTHTFGATDPCACLDEIATVLQDLADVLREASRGPTAGDDTVVTGNA
jgi:hypothetical protein